MEPNHNDYYLPAVTMREMIVFDPTKPETFTASRFINQALTIYARGVKLEEHICRRMNLQRTTFYELFRAEAGTSFRKFLDYKLAYNIHCELDRICMEKIKREQLRNASIDHTKLAESIDLKYYREIRRALNKDFELHEEDDYERFAKRVGFGDRTTFWRFVHSKKYKKITSEMHFHTFQMKKERLAEEQRALREAYEEELSEESVEETTD